MVEEIKIETENLNVWFDSIHALKSLNIKIRKNEILGIIGPANSGKTTFLRSLNRLNELNPKYHSSGKIYIDNQDISKSDVNLLRRRIGMVFALPIPLPISVFDNISYGLRMQGVRDKKILSQAVEKSLKAAYLWDEVKDRLKENSLKLSGGQQQRLCIARALATEPEVILFDEPCSGLDPISTAKIEEAMFKLKENYTLILVTNNVKQAARVGDRTAFFLSGELIELNKTDQLFTIPKNKRTEDYIMGKFG